MKAYHSLTRLLQVKEWLQGVGPKYQDDAVGCSSAWRKGDKKTTIVYWRERKREQGKSLRSGEGLKYFKRAQKNGERYMRMMRRCK